MDSFFPTSGFGLILLEQTSKQDCLINVQAGGYLQGSTLDSVRFGHGKSDITRALWYQRFEDDQKLAA